MDSVLRVYDTARRALVPFEPATPGRVTMYTCGVTVYDLCHIGHARSYLVWDMVRRYLEFRGYVVLYVQNFTDIDDKIINRAREAGTSERELAMRNIDDYFRDMNALGIRPADAFPRATTHIPDMAELVRELLARDMAYVSADDSVYFRVTRDPHYGELSGRKLDDMEAGARVEVDERKEHPLDFAVWKGAKPDEPAWEIDAGGRTLRGRPGWHLECSAMVRRHLGDTIDIHTGGTDLIFPHHENEIAQSRAVTGQPLARYWLHNGFINIGGEKMSKSLRNFVTIRELLQRYESDAIRYFVLQKHYRTAMDFTEEALEAARTGWNNLRNSLSIENLTSREGRWISAEDHDAIGAAEHKSIKDVMQETYKDFVKAMDNDFRSPEALAVISNYARTLKRYRGFPAEHFERPLAMVEQLANALGLSLIQSKVRKESDSAIQLDVEVVKDISEVNAIKQRYGDLSQALLDYLRARNSSPLPQLDPVKMDEVRRSREGMERWAEHLQQHVERMAAVQARITRRRSVQEETLLELLGYLEALRQQAQADGQEARLAFINKGKDEARSLYDVVDTLHELRLQARQDKDYALADGIRQRLTEARIEVNDKPGGKSTWSWRPEV